MTRYFLILSCALLLHSGPGGPPLSAEDETALPFDPERIQRLSLDGVPRSLSIRQGEAVWLGYDLERAVLMKIWRAPDGKPGLVFSEFTTRSAGRTLSPGAGKEESWRWQRGGDLVVPTIRYLGCSQGTDHFTLSWEMRHGDSILTLREKIPFESDPAGIVVREFAVEGLAEGDELHAPGLGENWNPASSLLTGTGWHRFVLHP